MERGPFCYADPARIEHDLLAAGFTNVEVETIKLSSRVNARDAAQSLVFGSRFRSEIERRDPSALGRAADAVTEALAPWDVQRRANVSSFGYRMLSRTLSSEYAIIVDRSP
jgi:hypothetical protein